MDNKVHTFDLSLDLELVNLISQIDRFDASWASIEKKEGRSLKELKSIATVKSVGASTRIEGAKLSDEQVGILVHNIDITKLEDRDSQEVAGYFELLNLISESYAEIAISENEIKGLHNILLKFSEKDSWHRGGYKQLSNAVEARLPDGTNQLIFQTTEPGVPTQDAMRELINWYDLDNKTHPLVKCALFAYDFVSIHPFQDGNGRLSRLLTTLLLLKHGYKWIQYVSFEHEIESRKSEYYRVLRKCQANRPNEDVTEWLDFFFGSLFNIQSKLQMKLTTQGASTRLSPKEKLIYAYIESHAGCQSGEIAEKLEIPVPTVKRLLSKLITLKLIERYGAGRGTSYTII